MYDFILQLFMIGSASVILYLAARALPRVSEADEHPTLYDYIDRWIGRLPLHHLDERANAFLYKFLKRVRVMVLKLDNRIAHQLNRTRRNGENSGSVQELFDRVNGEKK